MEAALLKAQERELARPIYEYDLPEEVQKLGDKYVKKSIGLVKLRMDEEIASAERAGGNQAKLAYNWARYALVQIDGRPLDKANAEDEIVLSNCDPLIRELILEAYADISSNPKETTKKFLGSRKVKVG